MSDNLTNLILSLTPEDGSSIGNGAMMELLKQKMPGITLDDYIVARDELIDEGLIGRGRGRGGSIFKVLDESDSNDDDDDASVDMDSLDEDEEADEFALTPPELRDPPAPRAKRPQTAVRAPDGPKQILSYRHKATRVNNPEVGMVSAGTDPDGEKTTWAYDPHLAACRTDVCHCVGPTANALRLKRLSGQTTASHSRPWSRASTRL